MCAAAFKPSDGVKKASTVKIKFPECVVFVYDFAFTLSAIRNDAPFCIRKTGKEKSHIARPFIHIGQVFDDVNTRIGLIVWIHKKKDEPSGLVKVFLIS